VETPFWSDDGDGDLTFRLGGQPFAVVDAACGLLVDVSIVLDESTLVLE